MSTLENPETRAEMSPSSASPVERELFGPDYQPSATTEMFPVATALREVLAQRQGDLAEGLGLSSEARVVRHKEFVSVIRESRLDPETVARPLYDAVVDAQLAERRGGQPDAARLVSAEADLRHELRLAYGSARAERIEAAMGEFLAAHPKLATLFATPGLEATRSGKKAVLALVDHVRRSRHL